MFDYELAKQLKDAGFVIDSHGRDSSEERGCYGDVCVPTLSELIAACGDKFHKLKRYDDGWYAGQNHWDESYFEVEQAKTPEEAVALLWLALNK